MTIGPDDIYLDLPEAVRILHERQKDPEFCTFVREMFGELPSTLQDIKPRAVLVRYIGSPTMEFERFYAMAKEANLEPLLLEFPKDKFVAKNWEKYCLCRPTFVAETERGYEKIREEHLVNFNTNEGKILSEIVTESNEPLLQFHHRLLKSYLSGNALEISDFSDWFLQNRGKDKWSYYLRYLGLFLSNAILFENFLMDTKEIEFTTEVVLPAFRTLTDVVGHQPLIVRTLPKESENQPYWCYYNETIEALL